QRVVEPRGQLPHFRLDALVLVRHGQLGAGLVQHLRDAPGDAVLVRDADHQARAPGEIDGDHVVPSCVSLRAAPSAAPSRFRNQLFVLQNPDDFPCLRETARLVQRENHLAAGPHLERAARRRDERHGRQLLAAVGHQLLRGFDGPRRVAARPAKLDLHFQRLTRQAFPPSAARCCLPFYPFVSAPSSVRRGRAGRARRAGECRSKSYSIEDEVQIEIVETEDSPLVWEEEALRRLKAALARWREAAGTQPPRRTDARLPVEPLYTPLDVAGIDFEAAIGWPGEYPYTRGPYPTMYRGRLWTMRQYAGFGTPAETNRRFRYLLEQGTTGLSVA